MDFERLDKLQQSFGIIGESDKLKEIIETIDQVAKTDITVLISGESGTGKELVANAIHRHSLRKHQPLIKVNCGAIPAGILESELFGHVKGSFTGAIEDRKGYFEAADRGTIFLDEIGEMPLETQVKLLRVLELGEFFPVGGSEVRRVDVRVIAATNKDLSEEIEKGTFRKDLYYRIKTITVNLPPLRRHPEDIPLLVEKFALEFANRNNIVFKGFSPSAMALLREYAWPGNIRELKNFVESMIVLQKGEVITSAMVEKRLLGERHGMPSPNLPMRVTKSVDQAERELILQQLMLMRQELRDIHDALAQHSPAAVAVPLPKYEVPQVPARLEVSREVEESEPVEVNENEVIDPHAIGKVSMEEVEKELILRTLKKFNNHKRQAAAALKISERTLYRKLDEYGLSKAFKS